MRIPHFAVFCIMAAVLSACSSAEDSSSKDILASYQPLNMQPLPGSLLLPVNYKRITLGDLRDSVNAYDDIDELDADILLNWIYMLELDRLKYSVFSNSQEWTDMVMATETDYIKFDENTVKQLLVEMNSMFSGLNYERLDARYFREGSKHIAKLKFKVTHLDFDEYHTIYLLSQNYKTLMFAVNNTTGEEFEESVRAFSL
jgi:hypothetical protein